MRKKVDNIILINCDDLGYGDLGCYGSSINKTPAIDALAKQGMRCTDFYAASPVCSPSRGAMLTGCYPPRIGFTDFECGAKVLRPGNSMGLNPNEISIGKLLKQAGYATALVGKWHCGDQPEFLPTRHGFDYYYGLPYSNDMGRQKQDDKTRPPLPLMQGEEVIEQQPDQASLTSRYMEHCIGFIRRNNSRPFFLYLAQMHTHLPLYAPEIFCKNSYNGDYGACVEELDWSVAVLVQELERLGLREHTLIIFTSDNGSRADHGASNEPLRGNKASTYEGGIRVPCIFNQPGKVRPNSCYAGIISALDLYSSFAKLAGIPIPDNAAQDSLDHSALWRGETEPSTVRETFFYYLVHDLEAVRYKNWKLHISKEGAPVCELYDLPNDPGERNNLYDRFPQVVEQLEQLMQEQRIKLGDRRMGIEGAQTRCIGRVTNSVRLAEYDENHPYMVAQYDKEDRG